MSDTVLLAIIGTLSGGAGLFALVRALIDARESRHSREVDADDRLVSRLERRLDANDAEADRLRREVVEVRRALDAESRYTALLSITLARHGHDVPPRP